MVATISTLFMGYGLAAIVAVGVLGTVASLILSLYLVHRHGIEVRLPDPKLVQELFWIGAPIALVSFSFSMQSLVEIALLSSLTAPAVIGWLGASRTLLGIFMAPAGILAGATLPEMSRRARSATDLGQIVSSASRIMLAAGACAASALLVSADFGVALTYGVGKFDQSVVLLQLFSPLLPLLFLNFLLANAVFAVGRSVPFAAAKLLLVAIGSVCSWFSISYFQTLLCNGAIGIIVSFGAMELIMVGLLLALLPKGAVDLQILLHSLRAYLTFGSVALAFMALPSLPIWVAGPMFGLLFLAVAFATQLVQGSDVAGVLKMLKSPFVY